jgi:tetraacyldisaccharide 4'-kinase
LVQGQDKGAGTAILRVGMWFLSVPYGLIVRLRNSAYNRQVMKAKKAGVPVICIGNLSVGGTGKTPAVEWLARYLREFDIQVGIISRGYGSKAGPNDEAMLLQENLPDVPHIQNPNRVQACQTAVEELESEILILDDGFQHRRLRRELDIVLMDATDRAFKLLPAGKLREPLRGLARAHFLILTHADRATPTEIANLKHRLHSYASNLPIALARHSATAWHHKTLESQSSDAFAGKKAIAFCGLGSPASFQRTLAELHIEVLATQTFADHHNYTAEDVQNLCQWAAGFPADTLVLTSQKDFVKLQIADLAARALWYLRIEFDIFENQEALVQLIDELIDQHGLR